MGVAIDISQHHFHVNNRKDIQKASEMIAVLISSEESDLEWKFRSDGGDLGFSLQRKAARC